MKKQAKTTHVFGKSGQPIPKNAYRDRLDIEEAVVADGVTEIGEEAFSGCLRLKAVRLSGSVESIRAHAFKGCTALKSIELTEGLKKIGMMSFMNCTSLENAVVPGSVAEIASGAFCKCTGLKSVAIRKGVEHIGMLAFARCTSLESVVLPGSVAKIPGGAFMWCSGLKSVVVRKGVKNIAALAFAHCPSLESVILPESVEAIDATAFDDCKHLATIGYSGKACRFEGGAMLSGDGTTLLRWRGWLPAFSKVADVPASVTRVGRSAFLDLHELETVRLPAGVAEIGPDSFFGCSRLQNIEYAGTAYRFEGGAMLSGDGATLLRWMGWIPAFSETANVPDSVTEVACWAFGKLSDLKRIRLPAGVEKISGYAFDGCDSLEKVEYSGKAFRFEGGAMLSGDGATLLKWIGPLPPDKTAIVPASVTEVGDEAFHLSDVRSVVLPEGLEAIGKEAFGCCTALSSILIPKTVRTIGEDAFEGCEAPSLLRHVMVRVLGKGGICARKTVRAAESGKSLVRRLKREADRIQANPDAAGESAFGLLEYELRVTTCDGRELYSRDDFGSVRSRVRNLKKNEYSVECFAIGEGVWISRLFRLEEDELEALKKKHGTDDPIEALSAGIRETIEMETAASPALPMLWTGVKLLGRSVKIEPCALPLVCKESEAWGPDGRKVFEMP